MTRRRFVAFCLGAIAALAAGVMSWVRWGPDDLEYDYDAVTTQTLHPPVVVQLPPPRCLP